MSAVVTLLLIALALVAVLAVCIVSAWILLPTISEAAERARIERKVQEASWRIYQRAAQAFGQMLDAAREAQRREDRP